MSHAIGYSKLRVQAFQNNTVSIAFYLGGERYRYMNGSVIDVDIHLNRLPVERRESAALDLLFAFKQALDNGWSPTQQPKQSLSIQ